MGCNDFDNGLKISADCKFCCIAADRVLFSSINDWYDDFSDAILSFRASCAANNAEHSLNKESLSAEIVLFKCDKALLLDCNNSLLAIT